MFLVALAGLVGATFRGESAGATEPRCAVLKLSAQPKSGTTWLSQLLYSLGTAACDDGRCTVEHGATHMHLTGPDLDLNIEPKADKHGIPGVGGEKFGYKNALFPKKPPTETLDAQRLEELAATLRAEKTCILFMFRDPRDVVVSGCHYSQKWREGAETCDLGHFWRKHLAATAEWISLRYAVFAHLEASGAPVSSVFFEDLKTNFEATAATIAANAGLEVPARLMPRVQAETSLDALRNLAADGHLAGGETKVRKGEQCGFLSANLTAEDISWAAQFIDAMPRALRKKFACGPEAGVSARAGRTAFMAARGPTENKTPAKITNS